MRIMPCTPYVQQMNEKLQNKSGAAAGQAQQQKPRAMRQNIGGGGAFGGMTLNDLLGKMLPGGIGGIQQAGGAAPPKRTEAVARKLGAIDLKMKTGQPLTDEEMKVLEKYNPEAYQEAKKTEAEREQYRRELENCRSKEDVEELRQRKLSQFSGEVNTIRRSSMSEGDKIKAMRGVQMRMAATDNEFREYTSGVKYKNLPEKRRKEKPGTAEARMPEKPAGKPGLAADTDAAEQAVGEAPAARDTGSAAPAADTQPAAAGEYGEAAGAPPAGSAPEAPAARLDISA